MADPSQGEMTEKEQWARAHPDKRLFCRYGWGRGDFGPGLDLHVAVLQLRPVVLFHQNGADESDDRVLIWKDTELDQLRTAEHQKHNRLRTTTLMISSVLIKILVNDFPPKAGVWNSELFNKIVHISVLRIHAALIRVG